MKKENLKAVAIFALITFIATSIDPVAFANTLERPVSPFKTLEIPAEFGQVTDTVTGDPTAPAFIHIQSAHGNYEAEKNIEKLLGYIEKNSKIRLMLLEGAAGKLQPELFRIFPKHPDFNRKVTDKLMQEGYLTGPENFLINQKSDGGWRMEDGAALRAEDIGGRKAEGGRAGFAPSALRLPPAASMQAFGMENLDAYKKDREAFISVVKREKTAETYIASLRASIDKRFAAKLDKDLLNLVRREEAFGSGTMTFEGWLKTLGEAGKKHLKLDLSDAFYQDQYPFLIRYFRLQEIGSKIDREKAFAEMDAFIKELEKRKVAKEIVALFQDAASQDGGRRMADGGKKQDDAQPGLLPSTIRHPISSAQSAAPSAIRHPISGGEYSPLRRAFDRAFTKLPRDFSMKPWPAWTLYAQHVILMQELEGKGLQEETVRLKDNIQTALAQTPEEKKYLAAARKLYLLKRLFNLELTRSEYEELNQRMEDGGWRMAKNAKPAPSALRLPPSEEINALIKSAIDFYKTAVIREQHMFANALKKMGETKQQRAVIVTGGFHADGLKNLAAAKGCSYLQITPRITEVTKRDHEVYLRSMLGSRDIETSQIPAPLGLMRHTQRAFVTGLELATAWRSEIRSIVTSMINSEPDRSNLNLAFDNSIFGSLTPALAPVMARAEVRADQPVFVTLMVNKDLQGLDFRDVEKAIASGKMAIAEVSVDWARKIKATFPKDVYTIFIAPLSEDQIRKRMRKTGQTRDAVIFEEMRERQKERALEKPTAEEKQRSRAEGAVIEMARQSEYDSVIVSSELKDLEKDAVRWAGQEGAAVVAQFMAAVDGARQSGKKLILYSGPSATGKSPLWNQVKQKFGDQFSRVVLYTTRKARPGEEEGVDFHFVSVEALQKLENEKKGRSEARNKRTTAQRPETIAEATELGTNASPVTRYPLLADKARSEARASTTAGQARDDDAAMARHFEELKGVLSKEFGWSVTNNHLRSPNFFEDFLEIFINKEGQLVVRGQKIERQRFKKIFSFPIVALGASESFVDPGRDKGDPSPFFHKFDFSGPNPYITLAIAEKEVASGGRLYPQGALFIIVRPLFVEARIEEATAHRYLSEPPDATLIDSGFLLVRILTPENPLISQLRFLTEPLEPEQQWNEKAQAYFRGHYSVSPASSMGPFERFFAYYGNSFWGPFAFTGDLWKGTPRAPFYLKVSDLSFYIRNAGDLVHALKLYGFDAVSDQEFFVTLTDREAGTSVRFPFSQVADVLRKDRGDQTGDKRLESGDQGRATEGRRSQGQQIVAGALQKLRSEVRDWKEASEPDRRLKTAIEKLKTSEAVDLFDSRDPIFAGLPQYVKDDLRNAFGMEIPGIQALLTESNRVSVFSKNTWWPEERRDRLRFTVVKPRYRVLLEGEIKQLADSVASITDADLLRALETYLTNIRNRKPQPPWADVPDKKNPVNHLSRLFGINEPNNNTGAVLAELLKKVIDRSRYSVFKEKIEERADFLWSEKRKNDLGESDTRLSDLAAAKDWDSYAELLAELIVLGRIQQVRYLNDYLTTGELLRRPQEKNYQKVAQAAKEQKLQGVLLNDRMALYKQAREWMTEGLDPESRSFIARAGVLLSLNAYNSPDLTEDERRAIQKEVREALLEMIHRPGWHWRSENAGIASILMNLNPRNSANLDDAARQAIQKEVREALLEMIHQPGWHWRTRDTGIASILMNLNRRNSKDLDDAARQAVQKEVREGLLEMIHQSKWPSWGSEDAGIASILINLEGLSNDERRAIQKEVLDGLLEMIHRPKWRWGPEDAGIASILINLTPRNSGHLKEEERQAIQKEVLDGLLEMIHRPKWRWGPEDAGIVQVLLSLSPRNSRDRNDEQRVAIYEEARGWIPKRKDLGESRYAPALARVILGGYSQVIDLVAGGVATWADLDRATADLGTRREFDTDIIPGIPNVLLFIVAMLYFTSDSDKAAPVTLTETPSNATDGMGAVVSPDMLVDPGSIGAGVPETLLPDFDLAATPVDFPAPDIVSQPDTYIHDVSSLSDFGGDRSEMRGTQTGDKRLETRDQRPETKAGAAIGTNALSVPHSPFPAAKGRRSEARGLEYTRSTTGKDLQSTIARMLAEHRMNAGAVRFLIEGRPQADLSSADLAALITREYKKRVTDFDDDATYSVVVKPEAAIPEIDVRKMLSPSALSRSEAREVTAAQAVDFVKELYHRAVHDPDYGMFVHNNLYYDKRPVFVLAAALAGNFNDAKKYYRAFFSDKLFGEDYQRKNRPLITLTSALTRSFEEAKGFYKQIWLDRTFRVSPYHDDEPLLVLTTALTRDAQKAKQIYDAFEPLRVFGRGPDALDELVTGLKLISALASLAGSLAGRSSSWDSGSMDEPQEEKTPFYHDLRTMMILAAAVTGDVERARAIQKQVEADERLGKSAYAKDRPLLILTAALAGSVDQAKAIYDALERDELFGFKFSNDSHADERRVLRLAAAIHLWRQSSARSEARDLKDEVEAALETAKTSILKEYEGTLLFPLMQGLFERSFELLDREGVEAVKVYLHKISQATLDHKNLKFVFSSLPWVVGIVRLLTAATFWPEAFGWGASWCSLFLGFPLTEIELYLLGKLGLRVWSTRLISQTIYNFPPDKKGRYDFESLSERLLSVIEKARQTYRAGHFETESTAVKAQFVTVSESIGQVLGGDPAFSTARVSMPVLKDLPALKAAVQNAKSWESLLSLAEALSSDLRKYIGEWNHHFGRNSLDPETNPSLDIGARLNQISLGSFDPLRRDLYDLNERSKKTRSEARQNDDRVAAPLGLHEWTAMRNSHWQRTDPKYFTYRTIGLRHALLFTAWLAAFALSMGFGILIVAILTGIMGEAVFKSSNLSRTDVEVAASFKARGLAGVRDYFNFQPAHFTEGMTLSAEGGEPLSSNKGVRKRIQSSISNVLNKFMAGKGQTAFNLAALGRNIRAGLGRSASYSAITLLSTVIADLLRVREPGVRWGTDAEDQLEQLLRGAFAKSFKDRDVVFQYDHASPLDSLTDAVLDQALRTGLEGAIPSLAKNILRQLEGKAAVRSEARALNAADRRLLTEIFQRESRFVGRMDRDYRGGKTGYFRPEGSTGDYAKDLWGILDTEEARAIGWTAKNLNQFVVETLPAAEQVFARRLNLSPGSVRFRSILVVHAEDSPHLAYDPHSGNLEINVGNTMAGALTVKDYEPFLYEELSHHLALSEKNAKPGNIVPANAPVSLAELDLSVPFVRFLGKKKDDRPIADGLPGHPFLTMAGITDADREKLSELVTHASYEGGTFNEVLAQAIQSKWFGEQTREARRQSVRRFRRSAQDTFDRHTHNIQTGYALDGDEPQYETEVLQFTGQLAFLAYLADKVGETRIRDWAMKQGRLYSEALQTIFTPFAAPAMLFDQYLEAYEIIHRLIEIKSLAIDVSSTRLPEVQKPIRSEARTNDGQRTMGLGLKTVDLSEANRSEVRMQAEDNIARLNRARPKGYPVRNLENPSEYTSPSVYKNVRTHKNPFGWADPDVDNPKLTPAERHRLIEAIRTRIKAWQPFTKFDPKTGLAVNDEEAGLDGRGNLGLYGPNGTEDSEVFARDPEGELWVLLGERDGYMALSGGFVELGQEKAVGVTATRELGEETHLNIDMTQGKVVDEGKAHDWRDTNGSWVMKRVLAVLITWEEKQHLHPRSGDGFKNPRFVKVSDALKMNLFASHKESIEKGVAMIHSGQLVATEGAVKLKALHISLEDLEEAYRLFQADENDTKHRKVYDVTAPEAPHGGNLLVFAGLEATLSGIDRRRFTPAHIERLRQLGKFSGAFLQYLQNFTFEGDIDALQEGRIVTPDIPLMRLTATPVEMALIRGVIQNRIGYAVNIATKTARIKIASDGELVNQATLDMLREKQGLIPQLIKMARSVIDFGQRRGQGHGGLLGALAAVIGGAVATSNVKAAKQFFLDPSGTMAHLYIQFCVSILGMKEIDAFRAWGKKFPTSSVFLLDTFDTIEAAKSAAVVGQEMEKAGAPLFGVRLDSGNLVTLSQQVRKILDDAGLYDTKILVSNDLDEHKIADLIARGARIDAVGAGTNLITGGKQPVLKLNITESKGERFWRAKSKGTVSRFVKTPADHIAYAGYAEQMEELLMPYWRKGQRTFDWEKPWQAHERTLDEIKHFKPSQKSLQDADPIPAESQANSLIINPETDAILIVDAQRAFMMLGGLMVKGGDDIMPVVRFLLNKFLKERRFASLDKHPPGHISWASSYIGIPPMTFLTYDMVKDWKDGDGHLSAKATFTVEELKESLKTKPGVMLWPDHAEAGTFEAELHPDILAKELEHILTKGMKGKTDSYSAFFDNDGNPTGLAEILRQLGIKRIFLAGLAFDYCVGWSAEGARKEGFEVVVVEEGTRPVNYPPDAVQNMKKSLKGDPEKGIKEIPIVSIKDVLEANDHRGVVNIAKRVEQPIPHPEFPEEEESTAFEMDMYHPRMGEIFFDMGVHETPVTFNYFYRKAPYGEDHITVMGVRQLLEDIRDFQFTEDQLEYFKNLHLLTNSAPVDPRFIEYLRTHEIKVEIAGLPEGSVAYPQEPIFRIRGSILDAEIIETFILKRMNFNSLIATFGHVTRKKYGPDVRLLGRGMEAAQADAHQEAALAAFQSGGLDATTDLDAAWRYGLPLAHGKDEGTWLGPESLTGGPVGALGGVYKLVHGIVMKVVNGISKRIKRDSIKISEDIEKGTLPGDQKIMGVYDAGGRAVRRVTMGVNERLKLEPGQKARSLHIPMMTPEGKIVYTVPDPFEVRAFHDEQEKIFAGIHATEISEGLKRRQQAAVQKIRGRSEVRGKQTTAYSSQLAAKAAIGTNASLVTRYSSLDDKSRSEARAVDPAMARHFEELKGVLSKEFGWSVTNNHLRSPNFFEDFLEIFINKEGQLVVRGQKIERQRFKKIFSFPIVALGASESFVDPARGKVAPYHKFIFDGPNPYIRLAIAEKDIASGGWPYPKGTLFIIARPIFLEARRKKVTTHQSYLSRLGPALTDPGFPPVHMLTPEDPLIPQLRPLTEPLETEQQWNEKAQAYFRDNYSVSPVNPMGPFDRFFAYYGNSFWGPFAFIGDLWKETPRARFDLKVSDLSFDIRNAGSLVHVLKFYGFDAVPDQEFFVTLKDREAGTSVRFPFSQITDVLRKDRGDQTGDKRLEPRDQGRATEGRRSQGQQIVAGALQKLRSEVRNWKEAEALVDKTLKELEEDPSLARLNRADAFRVKTLSARALLRTYYPLVFPEPKDDMAVSRAKIDSMLRLSDPHKVNKHQDPDLHALLVNQIVKLMIDAINKIQAAPGNTKDQIIAKIVSIREISARCRETLFGYNIERVTTLVENKITELSQLLASKAVENPVARLRAQGRSVPKPKARSEIRASTPQELKEVEVLLFDFSGTLFIDGIKAAIEKVGGLFDIDRAIVREWLLQGPEAKKYRLDKMTRDAYWGYVLGELKDLKVGPYWLGILKFVGQFLWNVAQEPASPKRWSEAAKKFSENFETLNRRRKFSVNADAAAFWKLNESQQKNQLEKWVYDLYEPLPGVAEMVASLHGGYYKNKMVVLTNMERARVRYLQEHFPWLKFLRIITPADVGAVKPEELSFRNTYALLQKELNVTAPHQVWLTDDEPKNFDYPSRAGWQVYHANQTGPLAESPEIQTFLQRRSEARTVHGQRTTDYSLPRTANSQQPTAETVARVPAEARSEVRETRPKDQRLEPGDQRLAISDQRPATQAGAANASFVTRYSSRAGNARSEARGSEDTQNTTGKELQSTIARMVETSRINIYYVRFLIDNQNVGIFPSNDPAALAARITRAYKDRVPDFNDDASYSVTVEPHRFPPHINIRKAPVQHRFGAKNETAAPVINLAGTPRFVWAGMRAVPAIENAGLAKPELVPFSVPPVRVGVSTAPVAKTAADSRKGEIAPETFQGLTGPDIEFQIGQGVAVDSAAQDMLRKNLTEAFGILSRALPPAFNREIFASVLEKASTKTTSSRNGESSSVQKAELKRRMNALLYPIQKLLEHARDNFLFATGSQPLKILFKFQKTERGEPFSFKANYPSDKRQSSEQTITLTATASSLFLNPQFIQKQFNRDFFMRVLVLALIAPNQQNPHAWNINNLFGMPTAAGDLRGDPLRGRGRMPFTMPQVESLVSYLVAVSQRSEVRSGARASATAGQAKVTDAKEVSRIADEYDLQTPHDYAYTLQPEDIPWWAERGLERDKLRAQFQAQKTIRDLALHNLYNVATYRNGHLTVDALYHWANQLVRKTMDEAAIGVKFATQYYADETINPTVVGRIAEFFGLRGINYYARTLNEDDINYFAMYSGLTREPLEKEFQAMQEVRLAAAVTRHPVVDESGAQTLSALRHWAKEVLEGKETRASLLEKWSRSEARKTQTGAQSPEPSDQKPATNTLPVTRPSSLVDKSRSEARVEAADGRAFLITHESLLPDLSLPEIMERYGTSVRGIAATAREIMRGLYAVGLLNKAKAKAQLLKLAMPGRSGDISEALAIETRAIGRRVLGIRENTFTASDVFALGNELFKQRNGDAVVAWRESLAGATIAAIIRPADAPALARINALLAKADLSPILDARELLRHLDAANVRNRRVRVILYEGETLSPADFELLGLKIADRNIIRVTRRMLDNFLRVMEDLVARITGEQAIRHSA